MRSKLQNYLSNSKLQLNAFLTSSGCLKRLALSVVILLTILLVLASGQRVNITGSKEEHAKEKHIEENALALKLRVQEVNEQVNSNGQTITKVVVSSGLGMSPYLIATLCAIAMVYVVVLFVTNCRKN